MGKKREDYEGMYPLRKCHDCGKPTRDYRCAKCRLKYNRKFQVTPGCLELEPGELPLSWLWDK